MRGREHSKCLYRNTAGGAAAARGLGAPFPSQRHSGIRRALKAECHPPCSSPEPSTASRKGILPSPSSTDPHADTSPQQQPQLQPRCCPHPPGCHCHGEPIKHTVLLSLSLALRFIILARPEQQMMPPECPEIGPKLVGQDEDTLSEKISASCFNLTSVLLGQPGHLSALHLTPSVGNACSFLPSFPIVPLVAQC